ncbi:MAG TPA: hypothetical protein DIT07_04730 [Sphingobacteriaceae bacterium]|nr:hypothetical protein [Sphingobacteriaceae bacterium]
MKKKVLGFIPIVCLIAGFTITIATAQSVSSYDAKLVISPSGDTKKAMVSASLESSFEQAFPNVDTRAKNRGLTITSASIQPTDPSKGNLGMFKSIKIYLIKSDGSNEVLIASNTNIPPNAGNKIVVNLSKQLAADKAQGVDPTATIETIIGRQAGVTMSGGEIRVRGSDAAPLFIIDGSEKSGIQGLEPSDILSINVLKDASETGMYGVRGANGVIVIKTRAANSGIGKGSLGNFEKDSTVSIKLEYVLRNALSAESAVNVSIGFK